MTTFTVRVGKNWLDDYVDRFEDKRAKRIVIDTYDDGHGPRQPIYAEVWNVVKTGKRTYTMEFGATELIEFLNDAIYTSEDLLLDTGEPEERSLARSGQATATAIIKQVGKETIIDLIEATGRDARFAGIVDKWNLGGK